MTKLEEKDLKNCNKKEKLQNLIIRLHSRLIDKELQVYKLQRRIQQINLLLQK